MTTAAQDLKTVKLQLHRRQEYKRQLSALEKERRRYRGELDKTVKKNDEEIRNIGKAYQVKIGNERANLEKELLTIRRSNERQLKEEKDRYEQMKFEIQTAHQQQLAEMKIALQEKLRNTKKQDKTI
jgi:hypothetical protein